MGLMVDTNVFIRFEKSAQLPNFSSWATSQKVYISAITVSELLIGVHRANTDERRQRRSTFVEGVIASAGVLDVTTVTARIHAAINAELAQQGQLIGAHDLLIAATALQHNLPLLTDNVQEFSRVPGLRVIPFA